MATETASRLSVTVEGKETDLRDEAVIGKRLVEVESDEREYQPGNVRPAEEESDISVICGNPLCSIALLESVMRRGTAALLKGKIRGEIDYTGVLELMQIICKRHESNQHVAHAALDALDTLVDTCPPHAVAGALEEMTLNLLKANRRSGSVIAHAFSKFATLASTNQPCYGIILALKLLQPTNDVLIASCIDLMRTSLDKGGIAGMLNCIHALTSSASVPWKLGLVGSQLFFSLRYLLAEDGKSVGPQPVMMQATKRFLSLMHLLAKVTRLQKEMLVLGHHIPVLKAMARLTCDAEVQRLGLEVLEAFSSTADGRWLVNCSEVYHQIGRCIRDFASNTDVLVAALRFLVNMSLTESCWKCIVNTGVFRHVIACLYRPDVSPVSLYHCCTVLINLSSHKGWISAALYKAGAHLGLRHLLTRRVLHLPIELLTHACKALVNLTSSDAVVRGGDGGFAMIDAGIHSSLLDAVASRARGGGGDGAGLAMHACWVVANLSRLDAVRHVLVNDEFISRLVGVIALYATDRRVFSKALQALTAVAASADDKAVLGETRVPQAIVRLLNVNRPPLPAVLTYSLFGIFEAMAFRCEANKRRLAKQGADCQILRYMRIYGDDVALLVAGCRALFSIGASSDNKATLLDQTSLETIRRMMSVHQKHVEVQKQGLLVLAGMSLIDLEARRRLVEAGCHLNVKASMELTPTAVDMQTLSIIVLLRLARNERNLKDITAAGAVRLTELAIESFPDEKDIQNCGRTLLNNLCCGVVKKRAQSVAVATTRKRHAIAKGFRPDTLFVRRFSGISTHACPNCGDGEASELVMTVDALPVTVFQALVERGWFRRGGVQLFVYTSCHAAVCNTTELRVALATFDASRSSYKRVLKKCGRSRITVQTVRPRFTEESFELYRRYQMERHGSEHVTANSFRSHVIDTPLCAETIAGVDYGTFHQEYRVDGRLIGVGVIDVLPGGICSVYMYYDPLPEVAKLSLGVYSALKEIEFANLMNEEHGAKISHYYLGNFNSKNSKLMYKSSYGPAEVFCPHGKKQWLLCDTTASNTMFISGESTTPAEGKCAVGSFESGRFRVEGKKLSYSNLVAQYGVDCQSRLQNAIGALADTVGPELTARLAIDLEVTGDEDNS